MSKFATLSIWLGILAAVDLRWKKIPIWLLAAGGVIVTIMSVFACSQNIKSATELLWGSAPGILLLLMAATTKKAGIADGIVVLLLSLPLDYRECILSFVLSLLSMSIVSLLLLTLNKVKGSSKLPYLPFLWMGYMAQALIGLECLHSVG